MEQMRNVLFTFTGFHKLSTVNRDAIVMFKRHISDITQSLKCDTILLT